MATPAVKARYKAGDIVTIRSDLDVQRTYDGLSLSNQMTKYFGCDAIIVSEVGILRARYYLDIDNQEWLWSDGMLQDSPLSIEIDVGDFI